MVSRSWRLTALAGLALAVCKTAGALDVPPAVGHYETQNGRWAKPSVGFVAHGEALHYSPSSHAPTVDQSYLGVSFFPETSLQIAGLKTFTIDALVPANQICAGGKITATLVLIGAGNVDKYAFGALGPANCTPGAWFSADFINNATWDGLGLTHATLAQLDAAAKADSSLGSGYQIHVLRAAYDAITNQEAWFDRANVNGNLMLERLQDLSTNALLPDRMTNAVPAAFGYFQSRNMRWGASPGFALHGEAMHFSPWSHDAASDFASTSFFPQNTLEIRDLASLGLQMFVPKGSTCGTGEFFGPYMWLVLTDAAGTKTLDAFARRTDASVLCSKQGAWQSLDFVNGPGVQWSLRSPDGSIAGANLTGTQGEVHSRAANKLGVGYKIAVIRMNAAGGPELWFDQEMVNGLQFLERAQDFTSDALLLDTPVLPNGVVPYGP